MYNNRKIGISIRFYPDLMRTIDELAHLEFEGNVTETIISLVNDGLKLRKFQKMVIDNPEKQDEIISQMNAKVENESILDWLATKTDRQKKAYRDFLNEDLDGISGRLKIGYTVYIVLRYTLEACKIADDLLKSHNGFIISSEIDLDDELWKEQLFVVKDYVEGPGAFTVFLKIFLKTIHSEDIEQLEKLKGYVERSMQRVEDSITSFDGMADPDRLKKMFPFTIVCNNSEKEFFSILLSHVESRISEKKT